MTSGWSIGWALRRYRKEMLRLIAQIGMGTGAMAVVGGTVGDRRLRHPVRGITGRHPGFRVAGQHRRRGLHRIFRRAGQRAVCRAGGRRAVALAATVGAGATAELGAMRISEEIDALEVMGIKSVAFLASTRLMAGLVVIVPLYAMALVMAFLSGQVVTTVFYGQSVGTYEHYFRTFLRPEDVGWSVAEVIVMAVIVMTTHCYYGYNASGGPVGVGEAVGRSMRFSLVSTVIVVLSDLPGALRRRPELQPHGVAAMPTPKKERKSRTWPDTVAGIGLVLACALLLGVDILAVSRRLHTEDQADDAGRAGRVW